MHVRLMLLVGLSTVLAVIAVSALVAPVPRDGTADAPGTASPAPGPASTTTPVPSELQPAAGRPFVLSADDAGQVVTVPAGRAARIEVHAREAVAIQLGDDGPIELAEPGTPAVFPVFGESGAEGPILRLEPEREIGRVEVAGG